MEELNLKVGDKVVYCTYGPWGDESIEIVEKITPTGRIRLKGIDAQFNKNGRKMGDTSLGSGGCLKILTPELEKKITEKRTIRKCYQKLKLLERLDYDTAVKILAALDEMEK